MQNSLIEGKGLNRSQLQLIAVIAMLIDHISIFSPIPSLYYIMRFIGSMTIIIMCYFVAEGYHKTKNIGRYIIRMGIFAAVSQIPYYLYIRWGEFPQSFNGLIVDMFYHRNAIFTLFVGLLLLTILKSQYNLILKLVAIVLALQLSKSSDWRYFAVMWIVGFGLFYGSAKKQIAWLAGILLLYLVLTAIGPVSLIINEHKLVPAVLYGWLSGFGGFMTVFLLPLYNGERGNASKWIWYIFYPAHLLAIVAVIVILF